jgi:hypothetical protein
MFHRNKLLLGEKSVERFVVKWGECDVDHRGRMSEVRCQRSEVGSRRSEVGCRRSEVGGQKSGVMVVMGFTLKSDNI